MNPSRPPPSSPRSFRFPGMGATGWIVLYLLAATLPVLVLLAEQSPPGRGFWWDLSMALGFGGLSIMGLQSVLTARFRRATAPFGVDIIYHFHRWVAVAGFGLIAAHYLILRIRHGAALQPLNPLEAPWPLTAGRLAFLLFGVLLVTSLWRKALRLDYDRWRVGHAAMAAAALLLAVLHIFGVGNYTAATGNTVLWIAYSAIWLAAIGYVRVARPLALLRSPYRVTEVRRERGRSWSITLKPEGHAGLQFLPGQFAWLTLRASPFAAREHPFSFSGSAEQRASLRFTIKELGDFTRTIGEVKPGELAYVDGPHGIFTPDRHPEAAGFVFVAGGVGIAPIMSMLQTFADRGERRPLVLAYGCSRWDDVLFREEIDRLRGVLPLHASIALHEPHDTWTGLRGMLDEAVLRAAIPAEAEGFEYFICGPKPMTDSVQRTLRRRGVPLRRIHCELFDMA